MNQSSYAPTFETTADGFETLDGYLMELEQASSKHANELRLIEEVADKASPKARTMSKNIAAYAGEAAEARRKILTCHRDLLESDAVQRGRTLTYAPLRGNLSPAVTPENAKRARWWGYGVSDLMRELRNSEYNATVRMTLDGGEVNARGIFSYKFHHSKGKYAPSWLALTVCGRIDDSKSLGHAIVHFERGTECSSKDPAYWNDECLTVHSEVMNRLGLIAQGEQSDPRPNPHQPWCDLNVCSIDPEDLSTSHFGHDVTVKIGEFSTLTTQIASNSYDAGTGAFVEYHSENPNTPEQIEQLARELLELAGRIRAA